MYKNIKTDCKQGKHTRFHIGCFCEGNTHWKKSKEVKQIKTLEFDISIGINLAKADKMSQMLIEGK